MITFIKKYDDKVLARQAEKVLISDPIIDHAVIQISSKKGVVTLGGYVRNSREHNRALSMVRRNFEELGLAYERLVDEIIEQ
jgi:osmotically-inducible protein OsmY